MALLPGAEPFLADPPPTDGPRVGVVVCHGITGTTQSIRGWAAHLAEAGHPVHAPALPGHGTRWQDLNRTRWQDWYDEAQRAFDEVSRRSDLVAVAGLSMGGTLALRLAEERATDVAAVITVNPSLGSRRRGTALLPLLSRVVPSLPGIGSDIARPGIHELCYDRLPLRAAASLADLWRRTVRDLAAVRAPVLVFRSREDHVVEELSTRLLVERATGTTVTERVLEHSFHVATLDYDAPVIFAESAHFLASVGPRSPGVDPDGSDGAVNAGAR